MAYQKFKNIVTGWSNLVFKNPVIEQIAMSRIVICSECPSAKQGSWMESIEGSKEKTKKIGTVCSECKCPIQAKSRSPLESCPLGKWGEAQNEAPRSANMRLNDYMINLSKIMEELSSICYIVRRYDKSPEAESLKLSFLDAATKYEQIKECLYSVETGREPRTPIVDPNIMYHSKKDTRYIGEQKEPKSQIYQALVNIHKLNSKILGLQEVTNIIFANKGIQRLSEEVRELQTDLLDSAEAMTSSITEIATNVD